MVVCLVYSFMDKKNSNREVKDVKKKKILNLQSLK